MVLANSYPFLEVIWTMIVFFAFVVWLWLMFTVIADLFRRHDTSGVTKVLWIVFIVLVPYIGVFVYLIVEHAGMTERAIKQQEAARGELDSYVRSVTSSNDPTEQISKAKQLLDQHAITQQEFDEIKRQALAG